MCGRYSFAPKANQRKALENTVVLPAELTLQFNIAPTQEAYVIASDLPGQLQTMEWGLVPRWSSDGKNTGKLINARTESIAEKPSFREPLLSQRCLVPADSFYEWRKMPGGRKIPYRILLNNGDILFMAGIWEEWKQHGRIKRSFSIITTTANEEMSDLHNRMPVFFPDTESQHLWLSQLPPQEVLALLQMPQDGLLSMYPVSEKLNKVGTEGAALQERVAEVLRLF